jgi:LysM repeat protein
MILLALVFLAFLCLTLITGIAVQSAQTSDFTYKRIIVEKGDTLWGLTSKANHSTDTSALVHKTMQYNNLSTTYIQPGQVIYVPVKMQL